MASKTTVTAKDIKALNERAEKLNTARIRIETQRETLEKRLNDELASYEKKYGVKLVGGNMRETIKKIMTEQKKVTDGIQQEYDLKVKVVEALESGNVDEANALLGIDTVEDGMTEEVTVEAVEEDGIDALLADTEEAEEEGSDEEIGDLDDFGMEDTEEVDEADADDDDVSALFEDDEEVEGLSFGDEDEEDLSDWDASDDSDEAEDSDEAPDLFDEDDDGAAWDGIDAGEDEDTDASKFSAAIGSMKGSAVGSSVDDTFSELEGSSDDVASFDDDGEDFGFGNLMNGGPFGA